MKPKHKRLIGVLALLASVACGVFILLSKFEDNLIYFYPPKDIFKIQEKQPERFSKILRKKIRVGGMIKAGTYKKTGDLDHDFVVTDMTADLEIRYHGILPPIFREGQGVVAQGSLKEIEEKKLSTSELKKDAITPPSSKIDGPVLYFDADTLVTKHDEKYMPPEVATSLKKTK